MKWQKIKVGGFPDIANIISDGLYSGFMIRLEAV
jgi:hypothetical protein